MANIKYNKELGDPELDSNIYIDTDSVFFSHSLLDKLIPSCVITIKILSLSM